MVDYLKPDWDRSALLVIDVQNDFVFGPAAIPGTADRLAALGSTVQVFRNHERPIVHVVRCYPPGSSDVDLLRRAAVEAGNGVVAPSTTGADIPDLLLPDHAILDWQFLLTGGVQQVGPAESVIYKPRWSAFHRTPLAEMLRIAGVNTVVVAGCNLPNCPRATLFDASERDFRTVLVTDATSQTTPERLADLSLIGVELRACGELFAIG